MSNPKYIDADKFWDRLISVSENDWVGFDTIDEVLSGMPNVDYEIINDAHNEGYDVGYWAGRRDYEPKWIPVTERLPEAYGRYLVTLEYEGYRSVMPLYYGRINRIDTFYDSDSEYGDIEYCGAIAWMPLPEPYKGGAEE